MKRRRIIAVAALVLAVALLGGIGCKSGCGKKEVFRPTPVDGVPFAFDDGMDYYAVAPSVIVEGETVYAYYTSNTTPGKTDSSIVLRVGTVTDGIYAFGERQVVLSPSDDGWDAGAVTDADVIKGRFSFEGTEYAYLMAYQGCADKSERNHQIGFALAATPAGPFVKVGDPIITYDPAVSGYSWGVGQPSLVSYDEAGKVRLFYSLGETLYTYTMAAELDCSDCAAITGTDSAFMLPVEGLIDGVRNETIFNNAGFAVTGGRLITARDVNPVATSVPAVATAVQVASIAVADIYKDAAAWSIVDEKINFLDLAGDTDLDGWQRAYSASVVKDFYGNAIGDRPAVAMTVTSFDEETRDYRYRQGVIIYQV